MNRRRLALALSALLAAPAFAAETSEKKGEKKGAGDSFIQLPAMTSVIARLGGGRGVMTVEVGVDVADEALHKRVEESQPLLRDAYLRELFNYSPTLSPGQPPNPDIIGAMFQRATDKTLGKPGAKVLLGAILVN